MKSKNIFAFLLLILTFTKESYTWPSLTRRRSENIPYEITGELKCDGQGTKDVKIELKDKSKWFFQTISSQTRFNGQGKYNVTANIPDKSQESIKILFHHNCGGHSQSYKKLYSKYVTSSASCYMRSKMICNMGTIELRDKCDENRYSAIFRQSHCV